MDMTYHRVGDHLYPDLVLRLEELEKPVHLGKYGQLRKQYLQENRQGTYAELLVNGKLYAHLSEIDESARDMLDRLMAQIAKAEGVTETLKARDQLLWVQRMNSIRHRAAEIVLHNLIYV